MNPLETYQSDAVERPIFRRWLLLGLVISILLDVYKRQLKLSTSFANGEVSRRIASAASDVCSGEIIQTQRRFDLKLSVSDYFRIIEMKTAALFAAACELGAFVNEASPEIISALRTFGLRLGTAYQLSLIHI